MDLGDVNDDTVHAQPTWRVMADLMLYFEGRTFTTDEERKIARDTYRRKRLGRDDGDSLLSELLPYPSPNRRTTVVSGRTGMDACRERGRSSRLYDLERRSGHADESLCVALVQHECATRCVCEDCLAQG